MPLHGGGRYELVERLGAGGMGEVFRARDRLGGIVALKRLVSRDGRAAATSERTPPPLDPRATEPASDASFGPRDVLPLLPPRDDSAAQFRLGDEFRTLARLRHPNVIEVLDYGFDAERCPYFTMELLAQAQTITDACRDLPFEARVELLGQLMRAVRYLHRLGVLHRDLKPTNVLATRGVVKVVDFGLAHLVSMSDERAARWGSRGYRAPELAMGVPPSRASDLYAVGAIAREMFGGGGPLDEPSEIDPRIAPFVRSLLIADWRSRPHDADLLLTELERATGITLTERASDEIDDTLRSSPLIGRERELAILDDALANVLAGSGSAWLVHGESGIGKSRLVDELRTRALVGGALVLEGQAIAEGSDPYCLLLGVMQGLVVHATPTAEERSALLAAMPRLSSLLGAPDPLSREQLFPAIEALLRRVARPVVVLLEDLHWAGSETLTAVRWLAGRTQDLGLLLVATERDELGAIAAETGMTSVPLARLSGAEARRVAAALLGEEDAATERLAEESEGNPLILMELVRAFILHDPKGDAGPPRIESLMQQRLARLIGDARPLLELSAVIGREVRLDLLSRLAPETDLGAWVTSCVAAGVLERRTDRIRFTHARLMEAISSLVPPAQRATLHARVGDALEHTADPPIAELAHHFARAGDRGRTAKYASIAAERALDASAYIEAIGHLTTALEASEPSDVKRHTRWLRLMSVAHTRIGNYAEAHAAATRALDEVHVAPPTTRTRRVVALCRELGGVLVRTVVPPSSQRSPELTEIALAHIQLAESSFYLDEPELFLLGLLRSHALSDRGARDVAAQTYSAAGLLLGTAGLHPLARLWFERARSIAEAPRFGSREALATVLHREGAFLVTRARWAESGTLLERAQRLAANAGDRRQWQETTTVLGLRAAYRGEFAESVHILGEVHDSATKHEDSQAIFWSALRAYALLRLGDLDRAALVLREANAWRTASTSVHDLVSLHGFAALLALRSEDREVAAREARHTIGLVTRARMRGYWTFHGLDAATETVAELAATEESHATREALEHDVARAADLFAKFRRVCPFVGPAALAWDALRLHHAGRTADARARWGAAVGANRALGLASLPPVVQREIEARR